MARLAPLWESLATGSGFGLVEGPVHAVDLALGNDDWPDDPSTSTSGCEPTDIDGLDLSGPNDIALYLNFDIIGSPNQVFFIYDGDDSDGIVAN